MSPVLAPTHYLLREGEGELILVLGGFHFPRNADRFLNQLAEVTGRPVLSYDYLGRGGSEAPAGRRWDVALYVEQVLQLLDDLELAGDLTVLAYSFGGGLAPFLAKLHPDRVGHLVLSGAWGAWTPRPLVSRWLALAVPGLLERVYWLTLRRYLRQGFDEPDEALIDHMLAPELPLRSRLREPLIGTFRDFPRTARPLWSELARHPRRLDLVWGTRDAIAPYADAEAIAALTGATLHPIEGNHNDIWLQSPKREAFLDVLARVLGHPR